MDSYSSRDSAAAAAAVAEGSVVDEIDIAATGQRLPYRGYPSPPPPPPSYAPYPSLLCVHALQLLAFAADNTAR